VSASWVLELLGYTSMPSSEKFLRGEFITKQIKLYCEP
jgi:hypothetical protein